MERRKEVKDSKSRQPINIHLFSDDNPSTTVKGTGFKDRETALRTIALTEANKPPNKRIWTVNTMLHRAKNHPHQTPGMREAIVIFEEWVAKYKAEKNALKEKEKLERKTSKKPSNQRKAIVKKKEKEKQKDGEKEEEKEKEKVKEKVKVKAKGKWREEKIEKGTKNKIETKTETEKGKRRERVKMNSVIEIDLELESENEGEQVVVEKRNTKCEMSKAKNILLTNKRKIVDTIDVKDKNNDDTSENEDKAEEGKSSGKRKKLTMSDHQELIESKANKNNFSCFSEDNVEEFLKVTKDTKAKAKSILKTYFQKVINGEDNQIHGENGKGNENIIEEKRATTFHCRNKNNCKSNEASKVQGKEDEQGEKSEESEDWREIKMGRNQNQEDFQSLVIQPAEFASLFGGPGLHIYGEHLLERNLSTGEFLHTLTFLPSGANNTTDTVDSSCKEMKNMNNTLQEFFKPIVGTKIAKEIESLAIIYSEQSQIMKFHLVTKHKNKNSRQKTLSSYFSKNN